VAPEEQDKVWEVLGARSLKVVWVARTTVQGLQELPVTGVSEAPEDMVHFMAVEVAVADTTAEAAEARTKILVALMPAAEAAVPPTLTLL
jgi:hypothetical protein